MSVGTEGPRGPFTCCRNVSCIVARMDYMSSNGSGQDLATDEVGDQPSPVDAAVSSVSPWSEAKQSPALLEVQWKVMTQEEAGWRREEGSRGQVELGFRPPGTGVKSIRWRTSTSAGRDPGNHRRGILAVLTMGVGGELGLVPGTTA